MNVNLFTPGKLNCNQWCRILKMAGFKSAILTAKHCDGFCLWPSAYTTHSVKDDTAWMGEGRCGEKCSPMRVTHGD